jgi:hypothetical protein
MSPPPPPYLPPTIPRDGSSGGAIVLPAPPLRVACSSPHRTCEVALHPPPPRTNACNTRPHRQYSNSSSHAHSHAAPCRCPCSVEQSTVCPATSRALLSTSAAGTRSGWWPKTRTRSRWRPSTWTTSSAARRWATQRPAVFKLAATPPPACTPPTAKCACLCRVGGGVGCGAGVGLGVGLGVGGRVGTVTTAAVHTTPHRHRHHTQVDYWVESYTDFRDLGSATSQFLQEHPRGVCVTWKMIAFPARHVVEPLINSQLVLPAIKVQPRALGPVPSHTLLMCLWATAQPRPGPASVTLAVGAAGGGGQSPTYLLGCWGWERVRDPQQVCALRVRSQPAARRPEGPA